MYIENRPNGSSESFLVNPSRIKYQLVDAVIESGRTLVENNLDIWKVIKPKGSLKIGYYKSILVL